MTEVTKSFVIVMLIIFISTSFVSALTAGIGNGRMILYPEVDGEKETVIERSILVKNINNESVNITLEVDEAGKEFIELIDTGFILEPETDRKAEFLVKVKEEGTYTGKINVFFSSLEENRAGVALSSTIIVIAKQDQGDDVTESNFEEDEEPETEDITGEAVSENNAKKLTLSAPAILGISSFIILIALFVLMVILLKKGDKKRGKVNARKNK